MYISFTEYFYFDFSISAIGIFAYIAIIAIIAKAFCNYIAAKSNKNK